MADSATMSHNLQSQSLGKAHRMRLAVRLYRMGWQIKEIAAVINVSAGTVSKYIKQAKAAYYRQSVDDVQKWVADCLEILDLIESTANEQWLEEITRTKDKRIKTTTSGKGSVTTEQWEEDHQPDVSYQKLLLDVVKQRRELLSLDKQTAKILELRGSVSVDRTEEVTQDEAEAIAGALREKLIQGQHE
jgi:predicted transcriptional regulator